MKYLIEHLDPELFDWCMIEYKHISNTVGKSNLIFTNITQEDKKNINSLGEVKKESVREMNLNKACLLDPYAEKTLQPDDNFDYLIFGGILGDDPPQKRTGKKLGEIYAEKRNLGEKQMSTDTAVLVSKMIIEDKIPFEKIKFDDEVEIKTEAHESVILPFRYVVVDGKVVFAPGLIEHIKTSKDF